MRFGIKEDVVVTKTNIEGKALETRVEYRVYRKFLCGLFRAYLHITPKDGWRLSHEVKVEYEIHDYASCFDCRDDAESLIVAMTCNPDKFVRLG